MRATTADDVRVMDRGRLALVCLLAWAIPGAGHLMQRRLGKGLVFLCVLPLMFGIGLLLEGSLFPLAPMSQSLLTTGAALAERCLGLPWLLTVLAGAGRGDVVALTYEYGWVFMVVSGLLNCLVILDAFDIGMGRK
jgi:cytochrome bd-type quinol oxidase subunit 2